MTHPINCPECGGLISLKCGVARLIKYKEISVVLPVDLEIPTCEGCGEQFFDEELTEKVDAICAKEYLRWK